MAMLALTDWILSRFDIEGFWTPCSRGPPGV
jgi:hypothetical protein